MLKVCLAFSVQTVFYWEIIRSFFSLSYILSNADSQYGDSSGISSPINIEPIATIKAKNIRPKQRIAISGAYTNIADNIHQKIAIMKICFLVSFPPCSR